MFKAILIEKTERGQLSYIANLTEDRLPEGDVDVDVIYSTLNYKDGLAITRKGPILRSFPMVQGIDLVGVVRESKNPSFRPGDQVLLNGWGVSVKDIGAVCRKGQSSRESGSFHCRLRCRVDAR
jgi:acrylyl-CoA reductase (NADPH)